MLPRLPPGNVVQTLALFLQTTSVPTLLLNHPIVIFDGVCTMCNTSVDFLMRNDRTGRLRFASFQSEQGAAVLRAHKVISAPETIYVVDDGVLYAESDAVLHLVRYLGRGYQLLKVFGVVPRPLRNIIYRFIARHRYAWFGKKETCRVPTPEERSRFL